MYEKAGTILVCSDGCCQNSACTIMESMQAAIDGFGLGEKLNVRLSGCRGGCLHAPIVVFNEHTFGNATVDDAEFFVWMHCVPSIWARLVILLRDREWRIAAKFFQEIFRRLKARRNNC